MSSFLSYHISKITHLNFKGKDQYKDVKITISVSKDISSINFDIVR